MYRNERILSHFSSGSTYCKCHIQRAIKAGENPKLCTLIMAPTILEKQPSPLRAITQRLSLTPVKQLPQIVPYLAASLLSCKDILDDSRSHTKIRDGSEVGMLRHKFKTQLTTLLHAREVESRWTAVVLIKTTIEAGGVEILQGTEKWTRGLLEMMGVGDILFRSLKAVI